MSDIEEVRRRMRNRRGKRAKSLNDRQFTKIYNGMIKFMVILAVAIGVFSYIKFSPNQTYIQDYVLNDLKFNQVIQWVSDRMFFFQGSDDPIVVTSGVSYQHLEGNFYSNSTNEVLSFTNGRVIYEGEQDMLGKYITVLFSNEVEVTYGQLNDVFVKLYDTVNPSTIIGTYDEKLMLIFTKGEAEIDYDTFMASL